MSASKFQQLSDAFLKISQGFSEVASIMNANLEPIEFKNEISAVERVREGEGDSSSSASSSSASASAAVVAQPPTKKVKKERDPNQPKKPLNNYFLFQRDFRARYKESNPTASSTELAKALAEAWEYMSKEEAEYYENLAKEHAASYAKALEAYNKDKSGASNTSTMTTSPTVSSTDNFTVEEVITPTVITETPVAETLNAETAVAENDAETPKKKKKKNKEKRDKSSQDLN